MNKRIPPIVAGIVGFVLCIVIFWIEGSIFVSRRASDFRDASTGKLLVANDDSGHCVSYAKPSLVEEHYVDAKRYVTYPFGLPFGYGGVDVKCSDDISRKALAKLLATSVHAVQYTAIQAGAGASHALEQARDAAGLAALGSVGRTNWTNALEALLNLDKPPKTCEEIYPGATEVTLIATPLHSVEIACYDVNPTSYTHDADQLYTHCKQQFQFARYLAEYEPWSFGWLRRATGGSLGIPVYGHVTKPALDAWSDPPGWNKTTTPEHRAQILVGMRFGWSIFATVPVIILTSLLCLDCILFLIVELTLEERIKGGADAVDAMGGGERNMMYSMLVIYATGNATRRERFVFAFFGWVCVVIFRAVYLWAPFNFGRILPRPKCNTGGGWETDEGTASLEWTTMWLLLLVIILLPLSKTRWFAINYTAAYAAPDNDFNLSIVAGARRTRKFVALASLGIFVILAGQAYAAILFGEGWTEAVTSPPRDGARYTDADNWADAVYTKAVGAYSIAGTGGAVIAAITGRWLFSGRSFCSCLTLFLWLLLALGALLPVLLTDDLSLDRDKHNDACVDAFPDDEDREEACESRYWASIIGLLILVVPLGLMFLYCLFRNAFTVCLARSRGGVDGDDATLRDAREDIQEGELLEGGNVITGTGRACADELPLLRMPRSLPRYV
jgi:hypothetical protein